MTIHLDRISKVFGWGASSKQALSPIDLEFCTGIYGLIGPNGAGKTTLLRILTTLAAPTTGCVRINGVDLAKDSVARQHYRSRMGYMPQRFALYPSLTGWQFLHFLARVRKIPHEFYQEAALEEIAVQTGLTEFMHHPIRTYSGGMRRRLGLAQVLLGSPQMLFLDEPAGDLDPEERYRLHSVLTSLGQKGLLILSTHLMEDVSKLCTDIVILNEGSLVFSGPITQLSGSSHSSESLTKAYICMIAQHQGRQKL